MGTGYPRGQVPNEVIEYRANRSGFVYYSLGVLGIVAGFAFIGLGVATWSSPQTHAAYVTSPSCAEALLRDGRAHLARPCSVLPATLALHTAGDDGFDFTVTLRARQLDAFDRNLPASYEAHVLGWYDDTKDEPVMLQVYQEPGTSEYVPAKIYDPAKDYMHSDKNRPADKGEAGWGLVRLGGIVIAFSAVWMWAGRFMRFLA